MKLTRSEKAELIRTYCRTLENYMLEKLDHTPEDWNGLQLRNWFWMAAKDQYMHDLGRKEMADLKNEVLVRNL
jgi:hypothetical protein